MEWQILKIFETLSNIKNTYAYRTKLILYIAIAYILLLFITLEIISSFYSFQFNFLVK